MGGGEGGLVKLVTGEGGPSGDAREGADGGRGESKEMDEEEVIIKAERDHLGKKLTRILEVEMLGIGAKEGVGVGLAGEVRMEGHKNWRAEKGTEEKGLFRRRRRIKQRKIKNPLLIMGKAIGKLVGRIISRQGGGL